MKFLVNDKKWPQPGSVPFLEVLESISEKIDTSDIRTFIECGTGESGDNAVHFSNFFNVVTIENDPELYGRYSSRNGLKNNIKWILGDGRINLKHMLLQHPNERFLILLDDHNRYLSFIEEEMQIIRNSSNRKDHIVIVDDMKFAGIGSYPTVEKLRQLSKQINPYYCIENTNIGQDIYVIYTKKESK